MYGRSQNKAAEAEQEGKTNILSMFFHLRRVIAWPPLALPPPCTGLKASRRLGDGWSASPFLVRDEAFEFHQVTSMYKSRARREDKHIYRNLLCFMVVGQHERAFFDLVSGCVSCLPVALRDCNL